MEKEEYLKIRRIKRNGFDPRDFAFLEGEIWKQTLISGKYLVSNKGRVKSKNGLIKPYLSKWGYFLVTFSIDNIKSRHSVHRLIAEAFLGKSEL